MAEPCWRLLAIVLFVGLTAILPTGPAAAECPFCVDERGPTLVGDYFQSAIVLYGSFVNAKLDAKGIGDGTTDFVIEKVLKDHEVIKGKTVINLPKYIPSSKSKFIVFCDEFKGVINPYRGEEVSPSSDLVSYLSKALEVKDADIGTRLRFCFDYLNHPDSVVATDSYREFAKADYKDYMEIAKKLPAKTIAEWLEDPATPSYRHGLFASLLGHCGDPKLHGGLLRAMLDDPMKRSSNVIDGLLAGYVMLQPKEAVEYINTILKDDREDIYVRYAVLGTLRFFHDIRADVLNKNQVVSGMELALGVPDMSDFAMDDLRVWKVWDMTDKVLDLFDKESHDRSVIKRAILRFALCSPSPRAAEFVRVQRLRDPVWVSDTEEILRAEEPPPPKKDDKK